MDFRIENLTPSMGSEVHGVDLASADAATAAKIKALLDERLVLVFRDQNLTREQHKQLGRRFASGELHRHVLATSGDPEVADVRTTKDSKFAFGEGWHADVSSDPIPLAVCMLYVTQMPEGGGGDTLFANMYQAYEELAEPVKRLVRSLSAVHDGAWAWQRGLGYDPKPGQTFSKSTHPVVVRHPDTGRNVLYVDRAFTSHLVGVSPRESRFVLEMLLNQVEALPKIQCRVSWQRNTLVMWDNIATQHHAVWDYAPQSRYGERVSTVGFPLRAAQPAA